MTTSVRRGLGTLLLAPAFLGRCSTGEASDHAHEDRTARRAAVISAGTVIALELAEDVSTRSHAVGDGVTAVVVETVDRSDGVVLVQAGPG